MQALVNGHLLLLAKARNQPEEWRSRLLRLEERKARGTCGAIAQTHLGVQNTQRHERLDTACQVVVGQRGAARCINTEFPNVVYYDPFSPESVIYADSDAPERIAEVSGYFQYRFQTAFSANLQGDSGLQALESKVVRGLESMVAEWGKVQMLERVKDPKKVQPINPFASQTR
ncbi:MULTISPECIES: hypothetical protein [unclassified Caballeronia]|uniref:hypothetical protein n=1 Tax=unclassified Caballeronia TaxID=2646786 RepID=UPI002863345F|nr:MULTISPECIES: hypothetical protein [unclassified Caballeronia]MDR5777702.1 hypothetical protein [Caballeronia sp. LZ002]MDR5798854.1 hypothetical protein [Caballeronia sp. LZ001]MDR5853139.1 hypothetical protein [Caballeronia sp. LZ003]